MGEGKGFFLKMEDARTRLPAEGKEPVQSKRLIKQIREGIMSEAKSLRR